MTKSAAMEFAEYGICFTSVHPGLIETAIIAQEDNQELVNALAKIIPIKRVAQSEELINLVLYLAFDESSYSTGSELNSLQTVD